MEACLSAPVAPDDHSGGSCGKIGRYILRDLLLSDATKRIAFRVASLEPGEFGSQRIHKGSGDVHFDLKIPNGDTEKERVCWGLPKTCRAVSAAPWGNGAFSLKFVSLSPSRTSVSAVSGATALRSCSRDGWEMICMSAGPSLPLRHGRWRLVHDPGSGGHQEV